MINEINWYAVFTGALSSFFLGGLWYSPLLFGKVWSREANRPSGEGHSGKVFGISFVFCLVAATAFAWLLGSRPEVNQAVLKGAVVGFAIVAASFGVNYQFANRGFLLWVIDGGYHAAQFMVFGIILGFWH
ncbi:MAG: DUF1761 domain-containing protein [Gemmataceae bacterium]|nr:DUF1761 domain-containing protein [Gemmataceae bacterium]